MRLNVYWRATKFLQGNRKLTMLFNEDFKWINKKIKQRTQL